jgi:hypothetical protein
LRQVCAGCHGENGKPVDKTIPNICGQQTGYLYIQLRDSRDELPTASADAERLWCASRAIADAKPATVFQTNPAARLFSLQKAGRELSQKALAVPGKKAVHARTKLPVEAMSAQTSNRSAIGSIALGRLHAC